MTLEFAGVRAKPCPFCGGKELELVEDFDFWHVYCINQDCQAEGPVDLGKSGAIDKWNGGMLREEEE